MHMCHGCLMNLDVESLRTFLTVLDHGNMTRAAEQLNLSQSAVSRKMLRLEQRIGRPLLIRDGHALRATRDGNTLIPDARSMVEIHDRAVARLQSSELTGKVRLGSNGEVEASQIAAMLGRFKLRHPAASIEFIIDHSGRLADWVENGAVDLAVFQVNEDHLRDADIVLWTEELSWVTSSHTDFDEGIVPVVDFGENCFYSRFSNPKLSDAGIDYRVTFSAASSADVRSAVDAGIGIAVLATRYISDDVVEWKRGRTLGQLPPVHQILRFMPGKQSEAVEALIETIRDELTCPLAQGPKSTENR